MMTTHTITYPSYLSRARETQTLRIDVDRILAISGIDTSWRSGNGGYQYYSSFTIYTDVPERSFQITINDQASFSTEQIGNHRCAEEKFIPQCEEYLGDILNELLVKWAK